MANMNFSNEQREIIEAPITEKTVVMAAPASGKTATLTERLRYIIRNGVDPSKIVALTFTNNAAAEMRERLGEDFKDGMFMGTIHSYANMLLTSKGYSTDHLRSEQQFDELFDMLYTYPECFRQVDYLLCDESQDLNREQFNFITMYMDPKGCLIVGDIRQSIYQFKGAEPEMLMELMSEEDFTIRTLSRNYRNGKSIISHSIGLLYKMKDAPHDKIIPMRKEMGEIHNISKYDIIKTIKTDPNWEKWAILCRSNKGVAEIMSILKRYQIPCITFKQAQGDLSELQKKMQSNAVKVLTMHSSKGLEFDNVIVKDYWIHDQEALHLTYVAVTRARNKLYICY